MKAVLLGRREVKDGYAAGGGWRTAKLSGREYHSVGVTLTTSCVEKW